MAKGLNVPITVNKGGGASKTKPETQLDKLVVLAVQEGGDDNPFQDLGLKPNIIYRINDDISKFDVKEELQRVLKSFVGRLELGPDGIVLKSSEDEQNQELQGEMNVMFEYLNLDTDELKEFLAPFIELGDR